MTSNMDTIYEENTENNAVFVAPVARPRKILRAAHPQKRSSQQQNDENVNTAGRREKNTNSTALRKELSLTEKVEIRVDRLEVVRVLGEGAFGEVVLVVDRDDHTTAAAMKRICLRGLDGETTKTVKKEALLQRAVRGHQNVLRYLTMRATGDIFELYLEYADGGELFDQIEPDYGMEPARAQFFFRQLLNGLQYIHSCGICHRDIKPENLLLTKNNILKISDFGMASVFRHNGSTRLLETKCGTLPYAAPEVFAGAYNGEPVDVWSCGVVLVTMLVGELAWSAPRDDIPEYKAFIENDALQRRPWCRLDNIELSLLSMIFVQNPVKRADIPRIKRHPWYIGDLGNRSDWKRKIPEYDSEFDRPIKVRKFEGMPQSQPAGMRSLKDQDSLVLMNTTKPRQPLPPVTSFSQPVNFDSLVLNKSQISSSQFSAPYAHPIDSLVRRMTRFCVTVNVDEALKAVENACKLCNCEWKMAAAYQTHITCLKNSDLSFFAIVYEIVEEGNQRVMIDFRLSKGDGIEFKRKFIEFKKSMEKIICKNSSSWLEKKGLIDGRKTCEIVANANENDRQRMPPPTNEKSKERGPPQRAAEI